MSRYQVTSGGPVGASACRAAAHATCSSHTLQAWLEEERGQHPPSLMCALSGLPRCAPSHSSVMQRTLLVLWHASTQMHAGICSQCLVSPHIRSAGIASISSHFNVTLKHCTASHGTTPPLPHC
jgi:hypothetical protein